MEVEGYVLGTNQANGPPRPPWLKTIDVSNLGGLRGAESGKSPWDDGGTGGGPGLVYGPRRQAAIEGQPVLCNPKVIRGIRANGGLLFGAIPARKLKDET